MPKIILLLFVCAACFCSAFAESPAPEGGMEPSAGKTVEQKRAEWLDSRIPAGIDPADLAPRELEQLLTRQEREVNRWFSAQGKKLLKALGVSTVSALLCFGIGLFCCRLIQRELKRARKKHLFWELLHAFNAPVFLSAAVVCVFFAFYPILSSFSDTVFLYDVRIFFTLLCMIAAWAALNVVGVIDVHLQNLAKRDDNSLDDLMVKVLRNILRILVFATTILFIGQSIFRINITALLAGAGVVGLGVALAAKDTLSNFFGTIVILFDRPFKLGDRIQVGELEGIVCEVGMRSSKIIADDESVYTLPNSLLTTQPVRNINQKNLLKLMFHVTLTYDTTPEQMELAIRILHEITDDFHGQDRPGFAPRIFFSKFDSSSMNITVILWLKTESYAQEERWRTELNLAILKRFTEAHLNFAYPTVTTWLLNTPDQPLSVRNLPPASGNGENPSGKIGRPG